LRSARIIITEINSRRKILVGDVARMAEIRNAYKILGGKPEGKKQLGRDLGVDGRIVLNQSFMACG
jgi:hypothetical protein